MSENRYLVAARKYRPQRFNEIVAQQHVTETLQNAIRLDRLAHAYLFSGPRGVGKTTAARILAKAINCTTPLDERELGEPCRQCESCITFEQSRSLSILEIDAASNNRVEDIRELRDTILIPPQGSRKKVYIIDEVHMLSNAAFNALLKTLEEPPPHALFIFATTEPNKVLPTILSRCQRFDFRRIAVPEIIGHLKSICEEEHIEADEESLMLIAHKGDGALRDSLSAFDQAVSLCGTTLTYDELAKAFGVVGIDLFFEVTSCVKEGNSAGLLRIVDRILSQGYDLQEFLVGLANHIRNLLVAATMPDTSLIEAAESVKKQYEEAAAHFAEADLLRFLMIVADGEQQLKTSVQPRLQMELALLKMASMAHAVDLRKALATLDELEKHVQNTGAVPTNTAPPKEEGMQHSTTPASPPNPSPTQPQATLPPEPQAFSPSQPQVASIPEPQVASIPQPQAAPSPPSPQSPATHTNTPPPSTPPPLTLLQPETRNPKPETDSSDASDESKKLQSFFGTPALRKMSKPNAVGGDGPAAAVQEVAVVAEEPAVVEVEWIKGSWKAYTQHIKKEKIHVSALLQHTSPLDVRDGILVLSVPDEFHKRMLGSQNEYLLTILKEFVSLELNRITFVIDLAKAEEKAAAETAKEIDPYEYMQKKRKENPVIKAIFDEFGGEMVW